MYVWRQPTEDIRKSDGLNRARICRRRRITDRKSTYGRWWILQAFTAPRSGFRARDVLTDAAYPVLTSRF
jgi:hypothetical protein